VELVVSTPAQGFHQMAEIPYLQLLLLQAEAQDQIMAQSPQVVVLAAVLVMVVVLMVLEQPIKVIEAVVLPQLLEAAAVLGV
jgi:hypothetical protein